jgi:2-polyprenyl-3-methyl-5-hydroxy-6-metoxy-1,4-benzoquinol methylase
LNRQGGENQPTDVTASKSRPVDEEERRMTVSQPQAVNHHANRPGFAGLTGLLAGATMLVAARSRARLIVDLASVSESDRVVDIGCGPGTAVRAAARRGAQVSGVDPAPPNTCHCPTGR